MSVNDRPVIDRWFLDHLACPRDHHAVRLDGLQLVCDGGHRYPIVEGVPVMLLDDAAATIDVLPASLTAATDAIDPTNLYLSSLSLSDDERQGIAALARQGSPIDPAVTYLIAATNGLMYKHLIGRLDRYPIPHLPLPAGNGRRLLDVGCSWGRWTIAASQQGYEAVGIDPSLGAVMAARRAAAQLGRPTRYLVGDARHLPFRDATFDVVYSYSVIQHLSPPDARRSVTEMGRVLRRGGAAKVQMPTRFGLRCLYHQARRRFREPVNFEVRYWTLPELRRLFSVIDDDVRFEVDGYFGIGLQKADAPLMTPMLAAILRVSEALKASSHVVRPLVWVADSVFVETVVRA
ncbi:MAG: methyltransferase domain-containing protein [Vicinamibacterales bacterium]|jgi:SAM-dependent methyltransferase/uncharacterized protein YbaR (Trm112 family)